MNENGEGEEESSLAGNSIHSIIIASVYGTLILIVLIHFLIHWLLRRKRLKPHPLHVPGDRSFKHKKIREEVNQEMERVKNLTTDLRLVDPSFPPSTFGPSEDEYPSHWYRMKAFDIGADFVTTYVGLLGDINSFPSPDRLALPMFLSRLRDKGLINDEHRMAVDKATLLHTHARTGLEDFKHNHFQQLQEQLDFLHQILSSYQRHILSQPSSSSPSTLTTPTTPYATPTTLWRERLSAKASTEPLIETSSRTSQPSTSYTPKISISSTSTLPSISTSSAAGPTKTSTSYSTRRDSKGGQRPVNLELTPLVSSSDVSSPSVSSSLTPRGGIGSHVLIPPGTPV